MEQQTQKEIFDYIRMIKIEKTFLLASFPLVGYLITYIYQINFLSFFDIPTWFVQVTIENIVSSTILVLFVSVIISIATFFIILLFAKLPKVKTREYKDPTLLRYNTFATIFLLIPFLIFFYHGINLHVRLLLSLVFWIFLILIIYGLPYIYFPGEATFLDTIKKYSKKVYEEELEKQKGLTNQNRLFKIIFQPSYFGYTIYISVITVVVLISIVVGASFPANKGNFYLLNENGKNYILVDLYDKQLLTVSFDINKKITTGEIKVLPLDNISNFTYQNIGKINLYKSYNN